MASYLDKLAYDCEQFGECSKKCKHFNECLATYKLTGVNNNPSTLSEEISNFEVYDDTPNTQGNFNINICEVPGLLINKAIISQFNSNEDIETRNIISAALNKFVINNIDDKNTSSIIKYDDMKYHFVFNCSDCNSLNDFVDYSLDDEIFFYCRYCGKKHRFNLNEAINKATNSKDN